MMLFYEFFVSFHFQAKDRFTLEKYLIRCFHIRSGLLPYVRLLFREVGFAWDVGWGDVLCSAFPTFVGGCHYLMTHDFQPF